MWQLEIVRMRGDTVLQLPQPWSVTQSACQSVTLWDSNSVYSCVINMRESLCMCVCVCPCLSSGNRSGRSDSVAWPSVSRPVKWHACQLSWRTLSSCWPTVAAANVGHVLWQSDTAYTTTRHADRTWAVKFDVRGVTAEGPGSQRVSESCGDLCTAGDAATMLHLTVFCFKMDGKETCFCQRFADMVLTVNAPCMASINHCTLQQYR